MLNVVFALAARGTLTKKLVEQWTASAANVGLSPIVEPWLIFVSGLFVDNVIVPEVAVRMSAHQNPKGRIPPDDFQDGTGDSRPTIVDKRCE